MQTTADFQDDLAFHPRGNFDFEPARDGMFHASSAYSGAGAAAAGYACHHYDAHADATLWERLDAEAASHGAASPDVDQVSGLCKSAVRLVAAFLHVKARPAPVDVASDDVLLS